MMRLAVPVHVRIADIDGDLVFLDLIGDDYLCLSRIHTEPVREALRGGQSAADAIVDELLRIGLLTRSDGRRPRPTWLERPSLRDVPEIPSPFGPLTSLGHLLVLIGVAIGTAIRIRRGGPRSWALPPPRRRCRPTVEVLTLARQFRRLRPFFPRTGRCLPQSLMLRQFLARSGHSARLVLGVRTHPFEAHCWIEAEGYVLNDNPDHVHGFQPIAVF